MRIVQSSRVAINQDSTLENVANVDRRRSVDIKDCVIALKVNNSVDEDAIRGEFLRCKRRNSKTAVVDCSRIRRNKKVG